MCFATATRMIDNKSSFSLIICHMKSYNPCRLISLFESFYTDDPFAGTNITSIIAVNVTNKKVFLKLPPCSSRGITQSTFNKVTGGQENS